MDSKLRPYLAELLGTFLVVYVGAASVCASFLTNDNLLPRLTVTGIALAEGFTLAVVLTATAQVSGGFLNPAVALTLWVFHRLSGLRTAGLIAAQLVGSVIAGLAVRATFSEPILIDARLGTPHLKAFLAADAELTLGSLVSGAAFEAFLTFLIAFAVFGTMLDRRAPRMGGIGFGLAQAAVIILGFHLTGGSANPARWFGPAVWQTTVPMLRVGSPFADHAVYWAGPIVGALFGAFAYGALIGLEETSPEGQR
jgi:aquaporin Z